MPSKELNFCYTEPMKGEKLRNFFYSNEGFLRLFILLIVFTGGADAAFGAFGRAGNAYVAAMKYEPVMGYMHQVAGDIFQ